MNRRRLLLLGLPLVGGVILPFIGLIFFVIIILVPIAFLLSPFQSSGVPPAGIVSITQTYLPIEQAAVKKYEHCSKVPVYSGTGAKKKITSYREVCHGVTVPFVQAIMRAESDGYALATSNAGALGLMQATIGKFTNDIAAGKSPYDPKVNIMRGVQYLDTVYFQLGENLQLTAAGYNAGPGVPEGWEQEYHTSRWSLIATHQDVQTFAQGQTYNYVNEVMDYYDEFNSGKCSNPNSRLSTCN